MQEGLDAARRARQAEPALVEIQAVHIARRGADEQLGSGCIEDHAATRGRKPHFVVQTELGMKLPTESVLPLLPFEHPEAHALCTPSPASPFEFICVCTSFSCMCITPDIHYIDISIDVSRIL